jgi:hypothetical protein
MNGLFGAALEAVGFDVMRISCSVMRQDGGAERMGTHLALIVECEGSWLCDVGFGGSLLEPLPLAAGEREDVPYIVSLEQTDDGYWRFTESSGTTLADSAGAANTSLGGGATLGIGGALGGGAGGFDGLDDYAAAPVNLSGTSKATVEFWLKWNGYADDDDLAMELTENFNGNEGGFLIDPNSSQEEFGVAIGSPETRNNVYFARPSAGAWHHYAFVFDTTATAAQQITPYIDGKPAAFSKGASGTGSGAFADSSLYFMSRAGANLFGAGSLDEVAIYDRALSASQVATHFAANAD